jgi:hypothetical protein
LFCFVAYFDVGPLFCLVAYFVVGPLFRLVAYFDVGPLFRPVVLFGCLFWCWSVVSSRCFVSLGCSDGSAMCCGFGHQARALLAADGICFVALFWCYGFGHQARALLMFVISVVASGIKLGRTLRLVLSVLALLSLLSSGGSWENAAISSLGASLVVVVVFWW